MLPDIRVPSSDHFDCFSLKNLAFLRDGYVRDQFQAFPLTAFIYTFQIAVVNVDCPWASLLDTLRDSPQSTRLHVKLTALMTFQRKVTVWHDQQVALKTNPILLVMNEDTMTVHALEDRRSQKFRTREI